MIGRAAITTTATKTAVGFTVLGLVTTIFFLVFNAVAVFSTLRKFPVPEIKTVVVKGLEDGPAKVYLDIEFPGSDKGNLISAKTEGPLKVSVFIAETGKNVPTDPSLSVEIPSGIDINLASKEPSRVVIDDLEIKFDKSFDSTMLSKIVQAQLDKTFKPKDLPNVHVKIESRIVFKSLWIPLGAAINIPYKFDLGAMMEKQMEAKKKAKVKELTPIEVEKAEIIKNFDYKPLSVKVSASDDKKLEISAVGALPAALVPDFMTVEVPRMNFQASFIDTEEPKSSPMRLIQVFIEPFLIEAAPETNLKKKILVQVTLLIDRSDAEGLRKVLELVRDNKKNRIGIQIKQGTEFIKRKEPGGLMHWLRDFVLEIPVGKMLMEAEEKKKTEAETKNEVVNSVTPATEVNVTGNVVSEVVKDVKRQIVSAKFLKTKKLEKGGSFIFEIKLLHSYVDFFIGKLPVIDLETKLMDGTGLVRVQISSKEVEPTSETIDVNIEVQMINLREAVFTGIRASKMGNEEMHAKIPEIRKIKGLKAEFISENVISRLLSVFNLELALGDAGLESVKFQNSPVLLYPKPVTADLAPEKEPTTEAVTVVEAPKKKQMELFTKFAIENEEKTKKLNIGASIDLNEIPFQGDYAFFGWDSFTLRVKYRQSSVFIFTIHPGVINIGITGGIKPIFATLSTGITIPSTIEKLKNLQNLLKTFKDAKDEVIDLDFEIDYGEIDAAGENTILLDAVVPCKNLLHKDPEEVKSSISIDEDQINSALGAIKEVTEERTDFIGKVKNSVISFISYQVATLFFHVTYPNGQYCPATLENEYNYKINLDLALPTIEANVCVKEREDGHLKCFASAGLSRPMKMSIKMIDNQICSVESAILPQEYVLAGLKAIKSSTDFQFLSNEIPVHISVLDLPALVRFGEMAAGKRKQYLTIGPIDEGTSFNNFVGVIVSSLIAIEIPPQSKASDEKVKTEPVATAPAQILTIPYEPESPAILEVSGSSKSNNEFELLLGFRLPEKAWEGIEMVSALQNKFDWPAVQWGTFDYTVGVENLFEISIALNRGQIDLHSDGVVMSTLRDFGLRIRLNTDPRIKLGSTALRQVFGILKDYFATPADQRQNFDSNFLKDIEDNKFFYKFTMNGPRGLNDPSVFFAEGHVRVKEIMNLGDAIINRPKLPELPQSEVSALRVDKEQKPTVIPEEKDYFKNKKITMKTESSSDHSAVVFPCLIPAFCRASFEEDFKKTPSPIKLFFELENILLPITELIGSKLGPILKPFKMRNHPSSLELRCSVLSDIWVTMVLDGAGLASVGLLPFHFTRTATIDYGSENVAYLLPEQKASIIDTFSLPLKLDFPTTVTGLRSSMSVLRKDAVFMPPIAPAFFEIKPDGSKKFKPLSIAPFYISISSDDREAPERNNLISALIAAIIPESAVPAVNPSDDLLKTITSIMNAEENKEQSDKVKTDKKKIEVKDKDGEIVGLGNIDNWEMLQALLCIITGTNCGSDIEIVYNVKMAFAVKLLKLILPSTSIIRLYYKETPLFQFVADARKQPSLEVSAEKGLNVLGISSLKLPGFAKLPSRKDLVSEEPLLLNLQVIFGNDVEITAQVYFPFKVLAQATRTVLERQAKKSYSAYAKLLVFNQLFSFKPLAIPKEAVEVIRPGKGILKLSASELEAIRPERRQCIDNELDEEEKSRRLKLLRFGNSAIYFETGNEIISVGKKIQMYLQLRTAEEEVVCGLPKSAEKLRIEFIREDESDQGFIKLVNLFSYKAPVTQKEEKVIASTPEFNHAFNLFSFDATFLHTGRYKIQVSYGPNGEHKKILTHSFIYVKNAY